MFNTWLFLIFKRGCDFKCKKLKACRVVGVAIVVVDDDDVDDDVDDSDEKFLKEFEIFYIQRLI